MRTTLALVATATAFQRPQLRTRTRAPALQARAGAYLEKDAGGLYYVDLQHESGASAKVFVFGADVTSYKDAGGTEFIAVRPDAKMDGSKPISGGLSHCFPQFGPGAIQQHGFARNVDWDVVATSDGVVDLGEIVVQTLSLEVDPYPGTGTASGEPVASYGDLDDSQPIIVDDSAYGDLDLS